MRQNSYFQFINKLFSILSFVRIAFFTNVIAQETIPVNASDLVNAKLPANASRVNEANIPAEVNEALDKLVAAAANNFARSFEIRKKVKDSLAEEFSICKVPIGEYDISVKQANGKPFRLRQINPSDSVFGIQPMQTAGTASLLFNPFNREAKGAIPAYGNWSAVEILFELPERFI